jgi:hypothetical protein
VFDGREAKITSEASFPTIAFAIQPAGMGTLADIGFVLLIADRFLVWSGRGV